MTGALRSDDSIRVDVMLNGFLSAASELETKLPKGAWTLKEPHEWIT